MSEVLFVSAALRAMKRRRDTALPSSLAEGYAKSVDVRLNDLEPVCPRCGDLCECWQERCACGAKLT